MEEREVAGLRCSAVLELLSDYLDGELAPEARAGVEAHVAGCNVCERFGARFAAAVQTLRKLPAPAGQEGAADRLKARLGSR
ncbi:MAG: zf-HC2 domain-containing protein [Polyangiaceae bacterium]|jgi:anti-sigma factor RsiW|nr:zf-HC2 domain-containing protein [Polyangiaceae bacterium]